MTSENKLWEDIKTQYLEQAGKVLSSSKQPRSKEVLEDIRYHLDRRFAELEPHQQTREDFQRIITEMGTASDYAELLVPEIVSPRKNPLGNYLLLGIFAIMLVGGAILLPKIWHKLSQTVDKIDYPFVDDPEAIGKWESVDFVQEIEDFKPGERHWPGDLFLKEIIIFENGSASHMLRWTKGLIINSRARTAAKYLIRKVDGSKYMFLEWKSGDYTNRGMKPFYYVLERKESHSPEIKRNAESFQTVRPITSIKEFDDVRWKDMSKLDLSGQAGLIATLNFNQKTVWPTSDKMPAGTKAENILADAMNPGLGVRELHKEGITGKGVNVAIIDQPLYDDHPEFAGKIAAYYDTGCKSESSMHGPAVTSLLVGTNCGTAPDAKVYYAAAPSWTGDTAYQAKALDWIVEQNSKLPASEKIRVVSVSAAPSGQGSPFTKNQQMWDPACAAAEAAGIMVLDCTDDKNRGFIYACWYDVKDPEIVAQCTPGYPGEADSKKQDGRHILVPSSPRTTAEEYDRGDFSYQYYGRGGLSWSIPYCAGVLAMGWQVRPELTPQQMRDLLFQSAYTTGSGEKIINPRRFIELVKNAK